MATYNQHYIAGKRRKAKKMTCEQAQKLAALRRKMAVEKGYLAPGFNLCRGCAYYYDHKCTFDGSEFPVREVCDRFVRNPK